MSSYPELDLTLPTRNGEEIRVTTAAFTREGVAEVATYEPNESSPFGADVGATIITAKQARALADAFERLAAFWGEYRTSCPVCGSPDVEHTPGAGCSYLPE